MDKAPNQHVAAQEIVHWCRQTIANAIAVAEFAPDATSLQDIEASKMIDSIYSELLTSAQLEAESSSPEFASVLVSKVFTWCFDRLGY